MGAGLVLESGPTCKIGNYRKVLHEFIRKVVLRSDAPIVHATTAVYIGVFTRYLVYFTRTSDIRLCTYVEMVLHEFICKVVLLSEAPVILVHATAAGGDFIR